MPTERPAIHVPDSAFGELRTERLLVRRFRIDDATSFSAYRSDPDVARYQSWTAPFTRQQADRFIAELADVAPDTPGEWFQFAVAELASGTHVGDVAACTDAAEPQLAEVGVTIAPAAQGRGYATEALTALLDYLFVTRGKHRVAAACDVRNIASAALLERVGMRREAHHVAHVRFKGEWTDEYEYAVLAVEWAER